MSRYARYGENNWFLAKIEKFLVALNAEKSLATCQKRSLFALECFKMRCRLGLRARPRWGSLQRSPDPLAVGGEGRGGDGNVNKINLVAPMPSKKIINGPRTKKVGNHWIRWIKTWNCFKHGVWTEGSFSDYGLCPWDWSARYCTYRRERPSLLDLLAVRFRINFWLDGWGSISPLEIEPMHLSVEGLRPWDWSYLVLQYLREWPTPTVVSSLSRVLSLQFVCR